MPIKNVPRILFRTNGIRNSELSENLSKMRYLKAARREPVDRPPVWMMRQAGRYMKEYRKIREKHQFLDMIRIPELAAEITFQPIREFGMDAAILFSDILVVPSAMGMKLDF